MVHGANEELGGLSGKRKGVTEASGKWPCCGWLRGRAAQWQLLGGTAARDAQPQFQRGQGMTEDTGWTRAASPPEGRACSGAGVR